MKDSLPATWVVFRLSALGDIVLTTGVLDYWHRRDGTRFIYLTRPAMLPVLENNPAIAQTVALDPKKMQGRNWVEQAGQLAREFRGLGLLDLHGTLRSRILSVRWKGQVVRYPKRGLTRRLYNRTRLGFLENMLTRTNVPQRYSLALEKIPPSRSDLLPKIHLLPDELEKGDAILKQAGATGPFVALHPYATHPDKAWPREHWTALTSLLEGAGLNWIVVGSNPKPLFPGKANDLTGRTDLRQTCALLTRAKALATNDSGPMHLATAVGTPVAALFGPTSKAWGFYPAGPRDVVLEREDLPCRPCSLHGRGSCAEGRECLNAILPLQVLEAIASIIEKD